MDELGKETTPETTVPESVLPPGTLPPLRYRDLPEPVPIRKMIGPSVMLAGLALGSGEFILWPYITYQSGFVFFWACLLGLATQYFLNMEITRWSLATGESAITGFARLSRHWAWIFLALNILPWIIPAWAKGAAQMTSWLIWEPEFDAGGRLVTRHETLLSVAGLVGCGLILTAGKVVYETVEKVQLVLVSAILVLVVVVAIYVVRGDAVTAQLAGAIRFGELPQLDGALLLGALAFAGAGGTLNLSQSNYVKDKGYGMGRYIGRITSPVTGQEEAISEIGYHFPHTPENLARWRRWWRAASIEHFLSFFATCLICLVLLTLISYSVFYLADGGLRPDAGSYGKGLGFVWGEAVEIGNILGGAVRWIFLLMGTTILLTTEFGILDAASRVSTDLVKVNWLRDNNKWSESRLYYLFLWGTILLGVLVLLSVGTERASTLLLFQFTAAMNGGVMFVYSGLLLYQNRFKLRSPVRLSGWRAAILVWSFLFFGFFVAMTVASVWTKIRAATTG